MGTLIGQYRILRVLGRGGMGTVYVGEHTLIERRAAIKVLLPELSKQRDVVERFFNEAVVAAAINDPGIVQIFDFGFADDIGAYIVMELLEGRSLAALLQDGAAMAAGDALCVARQVASSMAAAHAKGIIHRDLKPDNIFVLDGDTLTRGLRAKVLDFGIAKLGDGAGSKRLAARQTAVGSLLGTPHYMPPEQWTGGQVDHRTDIYALGCVLYRALTGSDPVGGDSIAELYRAHVQTQPRAPSSVQSGLSPAIDAVVLRCLEKAPAARYPSMTALVEALDELLAREPAATASPARLRGGAAGSEPPASHPVTRTFTGLVGVTPDVRARTGAIPGPERKGGAASPTRIARSAGSGGGGTVAGGAGVAGPREVERPATPSPGMPTVVAAPVAPPTLVARTITLGDLIARVDGVEADEADEPDEMYQAVDVDEAGEVGQRGAPGTRDDLFTDVFARAISPRLRDALPDVVEFFRELFDTARRLDGGLVESPGFAGARSDAQRRGGLIELGEPVIRDLESRAHYVMFLDDIQSATGAPFGQIGTQAFRAQVDPLADQLATLDVPAGSVLIAVLAAPQLGQGARETIFALRKERNLFVVPIAAAEIRKACDAGTARTLLVNRIADLHTISDPFAVFESSMDPTCWIGFAAEVADLVKHIMAGGQIVSVAGPPGSGKTSMVAMAEYGCDTSNVMRQFVRIRCGEFPKHDPRLLIREIRTRLRRLQGDGVAAPGDGDPEATAAASGPVDLHATILSFGRSPLEPALTSRSGRPARRETGLGVRHQLVLVLDDADWLIRLASSSEPDAQQREAALELWRGLAELCASGRHTVIVTSIRDFQAMEQVRLERPVSVSRVPMRALSRRESDNLVTSLGELVGLRPTRRAFALLHRESGGNVYALRLLCSDVIRAARERPDYAPLASLPVTARMVHAAVERIAATGFSFRAHASLWLDDAENAVLQHVAHDRPRTARGIRRALRGSVPPARIAKALDGLELMSLVEHRRGRHRVRIPLFERWINNHLDAPIARDDARRQQWLSRIAIGFTCTALLFGGYWTWLRSTRSAEARSVDGCKYELDYPDRIGQGETLELFVYQDCALAKPHDIAVEPVLSSLGKPQVSSDCSATATSCTTTVTTVAEKQAHDRYQVRLRVDGHPVASAEIEKDRFAAIRAIGEQSVPAISFIPLLLSVVISFHGEMKKKIAQLLGRGGPALAPATASSSATADDDAPRTQKT